jgi:hypothetical protein
VVVCIGETQKVRGRDARGGWVEGGGRTRQEKNYVEMKEDKAGRQVGCDNHEEQRGPVVDSRAWEERRRWDK